MNERLLNIILGIVLVGLGIFILILFERIDCKVTGFKPDGKPIYESNFKCVVQSIIGVIGMGNIVLGFWFLIGQAKVNIGGD